MIVRVRSTPGDLDPHGGPVESTETRLKLRGAFTAPRTTSDVPGREGTVVGRTLFAPADADILPTDVIEVDGLPYEIDGEIAEWRNPHGSGADGVTVALKRGVG